MSEAEGPRTGRAGNEVRPGQHRGCPPYELADGTVVPVGTVAYRWDRLPAGKVQHRIADDHLNLYVANQNPIGCRCFWRRAGMVAPPPETGWIPIRPFARQE